jgi:hypothetical protein
MSEIFSVQLTAAATLGLAVLALATAILAFMAWRKQSREVRDQAEMLRVQSEQLAEDRKVNAEQIRVLGLQAAELKHVSADRDRQVLERRRAQAVQIFIMVDDVQHQEGRQILAATARNKSHLPVYDLWVQWRSSLGEFGIPSVVPQFLPEEAKSFNEVWTQAARLSGIDVSLDFRDASGIHWRTTSRGILTELCGASSPSRSRNRCTFAPDHDGPHSWQEASGAPIGG